MRHLEPIVFSTTQLPRVCSVRRNLPRLANAYYRKNCFFHLKSGRSSPLASVFLKHTALSPKNGIRITSHLLLRWKAWTHLHLSPSWMAGQATGSANANANFQSQERRVRVVRVSEAISVAGNGSSVSFATTPPNFVRRVSFLEPHSNRWYRR